MAFELEAAQDDVVEADAQCESSFFYTSKTTSCHSTSVRMLCQSPGQLPFVLKLHCCTVLPIALE